MSRQDQAASTRTDPLLRESLVVVGFLLLLGAAVVTVVLPELEDRGDEPRQSESATVADAGV